MNVWLFQIKSLSSKNDLIWSISVLSLGGAGEDRTPDPLRARQVLSQLSYDPIFLRRLFRLLFVASFARSVTY